MSGDRSTLYELWDLTPPTMPPRSRLYHLPPIGLGTPYVESLTGFIARLAEAHSVSPRALILRELVPLLRSTRLSAPMIGGLSSFWWAEARALNGTRTQAQDWVQVLETLTLRNDLRFLTFLPWAEVLDSKKLLRRTRAWCPACYGEWRAASQVVYDPLLWAVAAVTACPRHHRRLRLQCEGCGRLLPTLASRARSGHCPHCDRWLGAPPEGARGLNAALGAAELASQMAVVEAIGAMVAAAPDLSVPPRRERIIQAISALVQQVGAGNLAALARRGSLPKDVMWRWHRGRAVPRLDSLLRLCLNLGTTPLRLLTSGGDIVDRNQRTSAPVTRGQTQPPPPRKPCDAQRVRRALTRVVDRHESPPPCMREVARRLGLESANLYQRFPDICRAISARFQEYRMTRTLHRRQILCDAVRAATFTLHEQGLYPSHDRVETLLPVRAALRLPDLKLARLEALRDLGLTR